MVPWLCWSPKPAQVLPGDIALSFLRSPSSCHLLSGCQRNPGTKHSSPHPESAAPAGQERRASAHPGCIPKPERPLQCKHKCLELHTNKQWALTCGQGNQCRKPGALCTSPALHGAEQISKAMVAHSPRGEVELTKPKGDMSTCSRAESSLPAARGLP